MLKFKEIKNSVSLTLFFCWQRFCKLIVDNLKVIKEMRKKDNIKEEEVINEQETVQVEDNQEVEAEIVKEEPTTEELLQAEKDKFLRLFAEFENYKKRTSRERIELFKTAGQELMTSLLPIIDDFERALTHIEDDKEAEELRKGVLLIYQKFYNTLELKGLSKVETKAGDTFDAEIHEAITQIPAPSEDLKGKVIDCVEKGYKLGDKIIRYPKVVIGQ
jgi:molecular chaperone GrpE